MHVVPTLSQPMLCFVLGSSGDIGEDSFIVDQEVEQTQSLLCLTALSHLFLSVLCVG